MDKLYKLDYLKEISDGDNDFILDMLNDFIHNTPETLIEIDTYVSSLNWNELHKTVHKFVSTFDFIGATTVIEQLRKIESFAKNNTNVDQIPVLVSNIKDYSDKIIKEIKTDFNL